LNTLKKVAYSSGALGSALSNNAFTAFVIFFYVDQLKLPVALVSVAWILYGMWNAVNDPLLGYISDRTRSRFGRRIPYILFGTVPLAFFFYLVWVPPFASAPDYIPLFIYFVLIIFCWDTLYTMVVLNWTSLFPEMYHSVKERADVNVLRQFFGLVGLILGVSLAPLLYTTVGWGAMGLIFAVITAATLLFSLYGSKENPRFRGEAMPLVAALKHTVVNRSFLTYVLYSLFVQFTFVLLMGMIPFYTKHVLELTDIWNTFFFLAIFLVTFAALMLWSRLIQKYGPRWVAFCAAVAFGLALIPTFFINSSLAAIAVFASCGLGLGGLLLILEVLLAEIIDEDYLKTGRRREGIYFGVNALFIRLGISLQGVVLGLVMTTTGFDAHLAAQPSSAVFGLRLLTSFIPVAALVAALGAIIFFPLHGSRLQQLKEDVRQRRLLDGEESMVEA